MKILYAIQATGNGHLARARELFPEIQKNATVEILISGTQGDLDFPSVVQYKKHGLGFVIGQRGKIDLIRSIQDLRPLRLWKDIKECPVEDYDLVIHDFEPIAAHACRRKNVKNLALSHQASFFYQETPRPKNKNICAEWVLRNYAPGAQRIGLHFLPYHNAIYGPVIRKEIRNLEVEDRGHVVVYLPSYDPLYLASIFKNIKTRRWKVFAKKITAPIYLENVEIYPVSTAQWLDALRTSHAVICGAGFEGPSEVLFLGKKLLVCPMSNQYEQLCNATALQLIGVPVLDKISTKKIFNLANWLRDYVPIHIPFPDNTTDIVNHVMTQYS